MHRVRYFRFWWLRNSLTYAFEVYFCLIFFHFLLWLHGLIAVTIIPKIVKNCFIHYEFSGTPCLLCFVLNCSYFATCFSVIVYVVGNNQSYLIPLKRVISLYVSIHSFKSVQASIIWPIAVHPLLGVRAD